MREIAEIKLPPPKVQYGSNLFNLIVLKKLKTATLSNQTSIKVCHVSNFYWNDEKLAVETWQI